METLESKIKQQLDFNSDRTFIKEDHRKLSFKEFKNLSSNIAAELRNFKLFKNDLVLIDIKDPFYFAAYTFACFQLSLRPAFLNSYMKKDQISTILSDNTYGLFISDQAHSEFKHTKIDTRKSFDLTSNSEKFIIDSKSELIFFTSGSIKSKACVLTLENFFTARRVHLKTFLFMKPQLGFMLTIISCRRIFDFNSLFIIERNCSCHES